QHAGHAQESKAAHHIPPVSLIHAAGEGGTGAPWSRPAAGTYPEPARGKVPLAERDPAQRGLTPPRSPPAPPRRAQVSDPHSTSLSGAPGRGPPAAPPE